MLRIPIYSNERLPENYSTIYLCRIQTMSDNHYDTDSTLSDLDNDLYYQDPMVETPSLKIEPQQDMTWMLQYLASNYQKFGWETMDEYLYADNVFDEIGFKTLSPLSKIIVMVANDRVMFGSDVPFTALDIEASGVNVPELIAFLESEIQHHVRYITGNEIVQKHGNRTEQVKEDIVFDIGKLGSFLINLKLHFGVDAPMETL